ncbi:MAG: hypothetical protein ISS93_00520 [Candidatus Aenigmarchaeota archaeon]|nr:hypothetical protein [Candidatus Aenigmarchaeota archaeon]
MSFERQTAKKVSISLLTHGEWVKKEGMEPSFVVTASGENISRARIMATVMAKFVAEDEAFASITLDDSTDTIRAKTFKTAKPIDTVAIGDIVDVIGKVREWNDEIYLIPEVVCAVKDPNIELLRKLELASKGGSEAPQMAAAPKNDGLREKVLGIIGKEKEGISYDTLIKEAGGNEQDVEKVINDVLAEGICYEPSPGKIKKI